MPTAKSASARRATVTPIRPHDALASARSALARGAWPEAKRGFESALARGETPEALEGLALAAWWLDLADLVFEARQRAYRLYHARRDRVSAGRVAVWLAWDHAAFRGESAVASGWLQRARRLLTGTALRPEHAFLAAREGVFALLHDEDPDRALTRAADAIRISRKIGDANFEMVGGALHGFALVTAGRVADGMRELDEVNAAVLAGELNDPVAIGLACCYLVAACERVRDVDRAMQWCRRLKRFCVSWGLRPLLAVCRAQYASVCVWSGEWAEAEKELVTATDELIASRPGMTSEGQARLGELRRRQGRTDEAAALLEASGQHPLAVLGRIALALDRGDARHAANLADRHLRRLPAHNRTERAAALELAVRARLGTGSIEQAADALGELEAIARTMKVAPIQAATDVAAGLIAAASGDHDRARRHFEDAVDLYDEAGAPFEAARARLDLAAALRALGQPAPALEEVRRALRALESVDAAAEIARARLVERDLTTLASAPPASPRASTLTHRELDVVRLIATGHSDPRIAQRLSISRHTVHRHVANILTKLDARSRAAIVARAARLGLLAQN